MMIIGLKAENVKKLKVVEIKPEDNTVIISGKNEQGKTSVLDSIWLALGGREAAKGLKKPIREGEERAEVTLDLDEIIVRRTWTSNDKSYLAVENKSGVTFKSPQAMLNQLIGNLSFDPLAFSQMSDEEQKEALLDLVDIGIDLDKWEEDRKKAYDDRTEVNRKVKELEGQIAGIQYDESVPDEEVSSASILKEIEEAQNVKNVNDEARRDYAAAKADLSMLEGGKANLENEIADLQAKLSDKQNKLEVTRGEISECKKDLIKLNSMIAHLKDPDLSYFNEKLKYVDETNRKVREKLKAKELKSRLESEKKSSIDLSSKLAEMDKQKSSAITSAKFPIEGLGFDETGVTYKGIPFSQCSAAESLRVSLSIAMAANPKLKVLRITDGSRLDSTNMKIIKDMVKKHDYQCWIELVDESGKVGIYIEDGEIKTKEEK